MRATERTEAHRWRVWARAAVWGSVAFTAFASSSSAWGAGGESGEASTVQGCVDAATQTQSLRDESKLVAARSQAMICAVDACPGIVRRKCREWLGQIDASIPTLTIRAENAQKQDLIDVTIEVDGKAVAERLDGLPIRVDPGPHHVIGRTKDAVAQRDVLVAQGEKGRSVVLEFGNGSGPGVAPDETGRVPAPPSNPPDGPMTPKASGPPLWPALAGGAVAAGALVTFAVLDASAWTDYNNLKGQCGNACPSSSVGSAQTKSDFAEVSLVAGAVAAAFAGGWLVYWGLADRRDPAAAVVVAPTQGGLVGGIVSRF